MPPMPASRVIKFQPTADVLDAYRADLGSAAVESFSGHDQLWLAFGTVLQRAARLDHLERDSYLTAGISAVTAGADSGVSRAVAAARESMNVAAPLAEQISGATLAIAGEVEDAGAYALATTILDWAKFLVGEKEPRSLGRIVARQARILRELGELDAAREVSAYLQELAAFHGDVELAARAHLGIGVIARMRGNYPEARAEFSAVLREPELSRELRELHSHAHHGLLIATAVAGDFDASLEHGRLALERARDEVHRMELLANVAGTCLAAGQDRAALNSFLRVLANPSSPRIRLTAIGGAAVSAARLHLGGMVSKLADTGLEATRQSGPMYETADMLREIAEAYYLIGDSVAAESFRRRALDSAHAGGFFEIVHRIESMDVRPTVPAHASLDRHTLDFTADLASGDSGELLAAAISTSQSDWSSH
jgi:tetratricopeptide (TPR) repeat protein